MLPTHP